MSFTSFFAGVVAFWLSTSPAAFNGLLTVKETRVTMETTTVTGDTVMMTFQCDLNAADRQFVFSEFQGGIRIAALVKGDLLAARDFVCTKAGL